MKVALTGGGGLIGSALMAALRARGDEVVQVKRGPQWDPLAGRMDPASLGTPDAVVHLAGENLASGRWNRALQARIRDSRVLGTAALAEALASLPRKPRVLVSASAVGYYGNRGDVTLAENSEPGSGFLAQLCQDWEAATGAATARGVRVVLPRLGVVLAAAGGSLAKMVPPFKLGLGGPIGSGRQFVSWIALEDAVGVLLCALDRESLEGAVNTVAPEPVRNAEFARELGAVLGKPAALPAPAFALRLALGEMADEVLLASQRVWPGRLTEIGFSFQYPKLGEALRHALL